MTGAKLNICFAPAARHGIGNFGGAIAGYEGSQKKNDDKELLFLHLH